MSRLFCFGLGYSARCLANQLANDGWHVAGTSRTEEGCLKLQERGFEAYLYNGLRKSEAIAEQLQQATHLLLSIAPPDEGDPIARHYKEEIRSLTSLKWCGYLSTVGVYGNHDGAWIDEDTEPKPVSDRSIRRVAAEKTWLEFGKNYGLPVHIFRIAGIYGPGRSPIENLKTGRARRIVKEGQVFNRIHVEDIAKILRASINQPNPGRIYNITDNMPAPPQDVVTYAAEVLGVEPPPFIPFEQADLSPMGRSFYGENKRVSNKRIREELGVSLNYPTYNEGVRALVGEIQIKP